MLDTGIENEDSINDSDKKPSESLFPMEEKRKTVKRFIKAYQTGAITITIPPEAKIDNFHKVIDLIVNDKHLDSSDTNFLISDLFNMIFKLEIVGEFDKPDFEDRLENLEKGLKKTQKELKKTNSNVIEIWGIIKNAAHKK